MPLRNPVVRAVPAIAGLIPPAGVMRLLVVVGGGLLVLQSSQGLAPQKLVYLALATGTFAFSCHAVWRLRERQMFVVGLPWLIASLLLAGLIALSLPVSLAHGTPFAQWLRDAATYGLFAAAPVMALDAAASMRRGLILALTISITALGALSFALYWISVRNLAILPFEHFVIPTASLPTALFVVSLAAAVIDRPRRWAWIVLGGVTLGVFWITGSRSALFFLVALPAVTVVAGRLVLVRSMVASAGIVLVAVVFVALVQAAFVSAGREIAPPIDVGSPPGSGSASPGATPPAPAPTPRPPVNPKATLIERLNAFLTSPQQDGSVRERVAQYEVAWELFVSSPVVGVGLGHPFVWTRVDGTTTWRDFTADTPLILPAKLGVIGIAWLTVVAFVWVRFIRRLRKAAGITIPGLAMTGWAAILVVLVWTGFSLEDKGFSFALMFLLALALIEIERAGPSDETPGSSFTLPSVAEPTAPLITQRPIDR